MKDPLKKILPFCPALFLKTLVLELAVSLAFSALREKRLSLSGFAENGFLIALLFLCAGLFRLTRRLQFYSMLSYGVKRLLQAFHLGNWGENGEPLRDYPSYLETRKNELPWTECVASALVFMLISSLIVYVI